MLKPDKKRTLKLAELPKIEAALYKWFLQQRNRNCPVTGDMLKEKAKKLNMKFNENSG